MYRDDVGNPGHRVTYAVDVISLKRRRIKHDVLVCSSWLKLEKYESRGKRGNDANISACMMHLYNVRAKCLTAFESLSGHGPSSAPVGGMVGAAEERIEEPQSGIKARSGADRSDRRHARDRTFLRSVCAECRERRHPKGEKSIKRSRRSRRER